MSAAEWEELPWHLKRAYLEGMEQDETVPLTFRRDEEEVPVIPGAAGRTAEGVIDITGMLAGLEAERHKGR